jgi:hypothetical protein
MATPGACSVRLQAGRQFAVRRYRRGDVRESPNPSGLCLCGCGRRTPIARQTSAASQMVKGMPTRFCRGHRANRPTAQTDYTEQDCGYGTPCWIWQRAVQVGGYGLAYSAGRQRLAHRAYYELHVGPIPDGLTLDHLCRQRNCVNPAHLEPVSQTENTRRGSTTKLDVAQVRAMRRLAELGWGRRELAALFEVAYTTVGPILRGEAWSDLGERAAAEAMKEARR